MEMIAADLERILEEAAGVNSLFKRNLLKEYLQVVILDFIYSHPIYSHLVFYGGSCLMHCHNLPRLSEDLDFVDVNKNINVVELGLAIKEHFIKNTDLKVKASTQKFRIYLKFPILKELGLAAKGDSDLLFLKIEVFNKFDFCGKYKTEIIPVFKNNRSILILTFDLPTLMATKIRAVLNRKWEKTNKAGKTLASVKGRDYFDLMWYLQKGISPNLKCVENAGGLKDLYTRLAGIVDRVNPASIRLDLENFIADQKYVNSLSKNIRKILLGQLKQNP